MGWKKNEILNVEKSVWIKFIKDKILSFALLCGRFDEKLHFFLSLRFWLTNPIVEFRHDLRIKNSLFHIYCYWNWLFSTPMLLLSAVSFDGMNHRFRLVDVKRVWENIQSDCTFWTSYIFKFFIDFGHLNLLALAHVRYMGCVYFI